MIKYKSKKFLQLILTSSIGIFLSKNLYATHVNNEQEDVELNKAIHASLNEYEDDGFEQALLFSIQEENIKQNNIQIEDDEDDNEYLRAILHSMNVIVEEKYKNDNDILKGLIFSFQKEPAKIRAEPVLVRDNFLDDPESGAVQTWIGEEMVNLQYDYERQLQIIKRDNPHQFSCELTSEIIKAIEASDEDLTEFYGGRITYNDVLMPQYRNEQIAIKAYAKELGIVSPEENNDLLFNTMRDKHDVSREVSRRAYNILMGIDE